MPGKSFLAVAFNAIVVNAIILIHSLTAGPDPIIIGAGLAWAAGLLVGWCLHRLFHDSSETQRLRVQLEDHVRSQVQKLEEPCEPTPRLVTLLQQLSESKRKF